MQQATDLDPATAQDLEQFATLLRRLRVRAGKQSYRQLESWAAHQRANGRTEIWLNRSSISDALTGRRLPSKAFVGTFVEACGVPADQRSAWTAAWERVADHHHVLHPPAPKHRESLRRELADRVDRLEQRCDQLRQDNAAIRRERDELRAERDALASDLHALQRYAQSQLAVLEVGLEQALTALTNGAEAIRTGGEDQIASSLYMPLHPMEKTSTQIILTVRELARSIAFYRDKLGLPEVGLGPPEVAKDRSTAVLARGDSRIVLQLMAGPLPVDRRSVHLALEVADVHAAYAALNNNGVEFVHRPRVINHGEQLELWAASFHDPDGHTIALTHWGPRR